MLDKDLALLYGVKPIRLREQVKRNPRKFPDRYMFQLTEEEVEFMVSQNAIPSIKQLGGTLPYAFTEHGVLMLANVLKSEKAIEMSLRIIELFIKLREMLLTQKDVLLKLEQLENQVMKHNENIEVLFTAIKQLLQPEQKERVPIGYKIRE